MESDDPSSDVEYTPFGFVNYKERCEQLKELLGSSIKTMNGMDKNVMKKLLEQNARNTLSSLAIYSPPAIKVTAGGKPKTKM